MDGLFSTEQLFELANSAYQWVLDNVIVLGTAVQLLVVPYPKFKMLKQSMTLSWSMRGRIFQIICFKSLSHFLTGKQTI